MTRGSEVQKKRKCIFSLARAIVFRGMWCNVESVLQHLAHTHILKTHKWSVVRKYLWWSNCMDKYRRITSSISEVTLIYKLWFSTVNFTSRHIKMIIHIRRCQHPCFCGSGSWPMETLTTVVGNTTDPQYCFLSEQPFGGLSLCYQLRTSTGSRTRYETGINPRLTIKDHRLSVSDNSDRQ